MRMLFVANTEPNPNQGASGCDISVIRALREMGHEVDDVWTAQEPRRIHHHNLHQLLELPRTFADVVRDYCDRQGYDVIQVNQPHAYLAAKQHQLANRRGVFINRSHGWEPVVRQALSRYVGWKNDHRPVWRQLASRALALPLERHNQQCVRWSDGIVVCSVDDRDYLLNHHKAVPARVLALAPGISPDFLNAHLPADNNRWNKLLYAGSFMPQKAPEIVAEVFRKVVEARPQASLTWVCPSSYHDRARGLLGSQAEARVSFLDWMPRDELRCLFDRHGVFLFPSYFEGFSLTFLEAMARGLCVIGTRVDGMRQVIRHGIDGFIFEPGDAEGMGRQAVELLANPEHCGRISSESRRTAAKFTWKRTAEEFIAFCDRLLRLKHE